MVAIVGLTLALTGGRSASLLTMPLSPRSVLMVPQPQFILANLSAELQLLSSTIGVAVIRALGIAVFLEGNVIDLGSYKLQVVDACAGLRYLFPLMAVGLLVGYFYKGALWKRESVRVPRERPAADHSNEQPARRHGSCDGRGGAGAWPKASCTSFLAGRCSSAQRGPCWCRACPRCSTAWVPSTGTWQRQLFGLEFPTPNTRFRSRAASPHVPVPLVAAAMGAAAASSALLSALVSTHAELAPERQEFATFPQALARWKGNRDPSRRRDSRYGFNWATSCCPSGLPAGTAGSAGEFLRCLLRDPARQADRAFRRAPAPGGRLGASIDASQVDFFQPGLRAQPMVITNGDARELDYLLVRPAQAEPDQQVCREKWC